MHTEGKAPRVSDLRVDLIDRPLGLENPQPRLSWRLESDARNVLQSAYRILVASKEEMLRDGLGDVWDSGKVESRQSTGVRYSGRPLVSRGRYYWSVEVWDQAGLASGDEHNSWWEMGLLDAKEWTGHWVAAEDPTAEADRNIGLQWIWGGNIGDLRLRGFRGRVTLPETAVGGEFFASANGLFGTIAGIWIDGARPAAVDEHYWTNGLSSGLWVPIQSLCPGEHLVAIAVRPLEARTFSSNAIRADGLTFFARLKLDNGETLRVRSAADWKSSAVLDGSWYSCNHGDGTWEAVQAASVGDYEPWAAGPAVYLRREFSVNGPVVCARLYATALGAYEAYLNGRRIGDGRLAPEPAQYDKTVYYRVYDVTEFLVPGANALGILAGDGWYASAEGRFEWGAPPRRVRAQLELTLTDGSRSVVATGPDWRTSQTAIRVSQMRMGEMQDARLELPGWNTAHFNDAEWRAAEICPTPPCRLVAQTIPPIRPIRTLTPRTISEPKAGTYIFDFGENFAGWCRLRVKGRRGTRIELRFAELLTDSGEVDPSANANMGEPKRDIFILRGDVSGELFEPHFTYRGFRYVQVTGLPSAPTNNSLEGIVAHTDLAITGLLRTDNPLIERIWQATLRTQRSNLIGIPTDCPSREQRGWLADAAGFWDAATFNMDLSAFTSRYMDVIADCQLPDGAFPQLAPWPRKFAGAITGPPGWGDGGIVLPWLIWKRYGDTSIIERHWTAMHRYVQFILRNNPNHLWQNKRGIDYGDWLAPDQQTFDPRSATSTPKELIGTAYWARSTDLLSQMSNAIGRVEDSQRLRNLFERIREAFVKAYVRSDGVVGDGSQTCYVMALHFGLLPSELCKVAAERLATDIRQRGVALTTGFLGTQFLLDVLCENGFADLSYGLLLRTKYPSWGYMLCQGATTLWESWSGEIEHESKRVKISQNHFALGSVCGFMFRHFAGIDCAEPGFSTVLVRPVRDARVKCGGGDYDSVMGRISTDWMYTSDGAFALEVSIPPNATALIYLPANDEQQIEEGGIDISLSDHIRVLGRLEEETVVEIGSGRYRFMVRALRHPRTIAERPMY